MAPEFELNFPNPVETRADLFDRDSQLALVQQTLRSPAGRPVVIKGERVMGKTSLLNIVIEWAKREPQFRVLLLPQVSTREALWEEILDGMAAEAHTSLHRLGLRDAEGRLRLSTTTEFARVAADLGAIANATFLLCIDELDSMLVNCPDPRSANQIHDFILHIVTKSTLPVKFLVTMTRIDSQTIRSDPSPFLSAARITDLIPWNGDEARDYVAKLAHPSFTVDPDASELLAAAGGGHPYLTKAILHTLRDRIWPTGPTTVTIDDVRDSIVATVATSEVDFTLDNIATVHFSAEELRVLWQLATSAEPMAAAQLSAPASLLHGLERRGYARSDGAGRFGHAYALLAEWLRHKPWADRWHPQTGPDQVGDVSLPKLQIDIARKRVFLDKKEIPVTAQEYRFLNFLASHAGSVVDRYTIAMEVWPDEVLLDGVREGRLDALVYRLREELGPHGSVYIETRRGRGYYMNPELVHLVDDGSS